MSAQPGPLFPEAFRVEHHLVQDDGDGSRFVGEAVVDTYGGSWIVSQRPDGSRLIVDFARRELTEVRVDRGVYWTVSFGRFAELRSRLRAAQGLGQVEERRRGAAPAPERPAPAGPRRATTTGPAGVERRSRAGRHRGGGRRRLPW